MKLSFPLYIVIDPTRADEVIGDIYWQCADFAALTGYERHADAHPVLYTDADEATADATARLAARAPEWTPLRSLSAGAMFVARDGRRGVKEAERGLNGSCLWVEIGTGNKHRSEGNLEVKETK